MANVQVDMEQVTAQTVQGLGAENAMLRFELNARAASIAALEARVAEFEAAAAEAPPAD